MDSFEPTATPEPLGRPLTRRQLLKGLGLAAIGVAAAACAPGGAPAAQPTKPAGAPASAPTTAPAAAAPSGGGTLKIGAIFPFTGSLALLGEESWRGAELARLQQNSKGGLLGKQIEWVKGDAPDANAAVSEANRMISSEKLPIIVGTYSSTLSQAATEVAERNKTIYWEMGAISDPITQRGFQYLFRTCANGSSDGIVAADFTKEAIAPKLGIDPSKLRFAVVHEDALYGTTVGTAAEKRAKEIGLNFLSREPYNSQATDLSSLILKLKSLQPDVLVATSYIQDLLLFWKQARELGFSAKAVIGTGAGYSLTDFAKSLGDDANGVLNIDFPQYDVNENFAKGIKEYQKFYQDTFKEPPRSGHSLANYMGALVLWDVIAKAGSTDPEAVRKAALAEDIPVGGTITGWGVKFAGPGEKDAGQNLRAAPIVMQWQKGRQMAVYPKEAAVSDLALPWKPSWAK